MKPQSQQFVNKPHVSLAEKAAEMLYMSQIPSGIRGSNITKSKKRRK